MENNEELKTEAVEEVTAAKVEETEAVQEAAAEVQADTPAAEANSVEPEVAPAAEQSAETVPAEDDQPKRGRRQRRQKIETSREDKPVSDWTERVVQISRVTKVVKGGKKLSFRAVVIVGNQKGQVGVGCAKASEVIIAIQKAIADGRKNLITVPIFKTSIPHPITGRSGAGEVMLRPASVGTGIIAGGAVRLVLELAGIENILAKSLGSKAPLNAAYATLNALKSLTPFSDVAKRRGLTMNELLN